MIVKFLKASNGGGKGSLRYALDKKRIENGTAQILRGDEKSTRTIIESLTKKQKTSFAVLSFEEKDIPDHQKFEIMDEFERTFFAGLRPDQYNILWVEHIDKGRLELNAIIPKVELTTGRSYNPYFHDADFHLKDAFVNVTNLKYGFTDPRDPEKQQTIKGDWKQLRLFKDYHQLHTELMDRVAANVITCRDDVVKQLKDDGIEVTREGKNYLSIKMPGSKKARRFEGGIYDERFTGIDGIIGQCVEIQERKRAFDSRDREAELRDNAQRLSNAISKRAEYNATKYREPKQRERATQERVAERAREKGRNAIVLKEDNRSSQKQQQETREARESIDISSNQKNLELNNDRIRSAAAEYARGREERERARARRSSERTRRSSERTRRSSERTRRIAEYASVSREATETDYRAIEEAHGWRQLRGYVEKIVRQLSSAFDAIANAITERAKEMKSSIDQSRKEAELQKLFDRDKDEQLLHDVVHSRR